MGSSRKRHLTSVEAGDVIFGIAANGLTKLLLVTKATKSRIFTRHVTSQKEVEFDRDGHSKNIRRGSCTIASVRPLPPDAYAVVLGLDRKMRLGQFPDGFLLSHAEIRLLQRMDDYFMARPLIDGEEPDEFPAKDARPAALDLT